MYLCISRRNIAEKDDCRGAGKRAGYNQECGRIGYSLPESNNEADHVHLLASSPPNASINEMAHCFRCSRSGRYARNIGNS